MGQAQAPTTDQKGAVLGRLIQHLPASAFGVEQQLQMLGTDVGITEDYIVVITPPDRNHWPHPFIAFTHPAVTGQDFDYDFHFMASMKRRVNCTALSRLTPATEKFTSMPFLSSASDAMAT